VVKKPTSNELDVIYVHQALTLMVMALVKFVHQTKYPLSQVHVHAHNAQQVLKAIHHARNAVYVHQEGSLIMKVVVKLVQLVLTLQILEPLNV